METYKIVLNEKRLDEFICWLPELGVNEKFYCSLFARKKYCPELIDSNDRTQLKRFLATKENLKRKLYQLELPLGRWELKKIVAPQESLVVYIHPNPRDMKKATELMGKRCWDLMKNNNFNLHAEALSCIQQSAGTKHWIDFDIDDSEADIFKVKEILPDKTYKILQTRGGYHLLVDAKSASFKIKYLAENGFNDYHKDWYLKIKELFNVDNAGDQMIPIPGCTQGGFEPNFIEI